MVDEVEVAVALVDVAVSPLLAALSAQSALQRIGTDECRHGILAGISHCVDET